MIEVGRYGIWLRAAQLTADVARHVEGLGFTALWIGGSPSGDLEDVETALGATDSLAVATGIVNIWRDDAGTVAGSTHRIEERYPERFFLGVGIGHPEGTAEYERPYDTIVGYLDDLEAGGVPRDRIILAALGPRALRLSGSRTAGTHPYLTTPRHTRMARDVMGDGPLLAPEQTVVTGVDGEEARTIGREFVARYLRLVNYRNSLLREGWTQTDLADGGSDRLVDELVLTGAGIEAGIAAHLDAGADHVTIQDIGPDPVAGYQMLATEVLA